VPVRTSLWGSCKTTFEAGSPFSGACEPFRERPAKAGVSVMYRETAAGHDPSLTRRELVRRAGGTIVGATARPNARDARFATALVRLVRGGGSRSGTVEALRRDPLPRGDRPRARPGRLHRPAGCRSDLSVSRVSSPSARSARCGSRRGRARSRAASRPRVRSTAGARARSPSPPARRASRPSTRP
jgi:hypothetical protein